MPSSGIEPATFTLHYVQAAYCTTCALILKNCLGGVHDLMDDCMNIYLLNNLGMIQFSGERFRLRK
jgi:hypothetical protein